MIAAEKSLPNLGGLPKQDYVLALPRSYFILSQFKQVRNVWFCGNSVTRLPETCRAIVAMFGFNLRLSISYNAWPATIIGLLTHFG